MLGQTEILVWNVSGGEPAARLALQKDDALNRLLAVSPDGNWLAVMRSREVLIFRMDAPGAPVTITSIAILRAVAFGPRDGQVTAVTALGKVMHRVYEVAGGKEL